MTLRERITSDIKTVFMNNTHFADDFVNERTGLTISALFDKAFATVLDDIETVSPAITVADEDIPGVVHGDVFTEISTAIEYNVNGHQADGTGITLLLLSQE